ncbi:MAG: adenylyl-sulfate reductase subunit alpha [Hespellia sp.]|nr:adenylyl-sulfate reductase subunit alpha [Hespellia sp.]
MEKRMRTEKIETDVLIIGGGTAGCYAALTLASEAGGKRILIAEKANIRRSGCLAAGVNALNAYIIKGRTPQDYVEYAKKDAENIVREDLLLTMSEGLNRVTARLEELGLVILKNENGEYAARGNRNIKINGENIKPLLADAVRKCDNVQILNHVNMTDLLLADGRVCGAVGFHVDDSTVYEIHAGAVLCATGGAAGLYRPNNPGFSRHKMWYPPFNTGAGYAMGIQAGAEMTTFEMRFIALRCKDTIAPTGTIAQGVGAKQVNVFGQNYEKNYGITTSQRVYGTVEENRAGRGPCYLHTEGITGEQDKELLKAYLNMAPSQTLKWIEEEKNPSQKDVEIEGTEPYIVGGHTASGYWIDRERRTTLPGLYAAGDVAGGCPQKYVTGALVEGELAAKAIQKDLKESGADQGRYFAGQTAGNQAAAAIRGIYSHHLKKEPGPYSIDQVEEAMQKVMDQYAGGIGSGYRYNEKQLDLADEKITLLQKLAMDLKAEDMDDLLHIYEIKERLIVCRSLIAHLKARKETRWHSFGEHSDYPGKNKKYEKFVNSVLKDGRIQIIYRTLQKGDIEI